MNKIRVKDLEFERSIPAERIQDSIRVIADQINKEFKGEEVLFIGILNGSFMFAADLLKSIDLPCQITFLKLASYEGTASSGTVKELIGLNEDLSDKNVIVAEDIVDSGLTLQMILKQLSARNPKSLKIASLLFKPEACKVDLTIDYIGLEIPNDFIVGYGLDYDGYGRNLADIYTLVK